MDSDGTTSLMSTLSLTDISPKVEEFINRTVAFLDLLDLEKITEETYSPYLKPRTISKLKNSIVDICSKQLRTTLTEIFDENKIADKIGALKELEEEYRGHEPAWRPPGDVESHCRSARMAVNLRFKDDLISLIKLKMTEIGKLKEPIDEVLKEIDKKKEKLTFLYENLINCKENYINIDEMLDTFNLKSQKFASCVKKLI